MISSRNDEESDEPLVTVDDEVAAHLFRFFMNPDQLGGREASNVAASRLSEVHGKGKKDNVSPVRVTQSGHALTLTIMGSMPKSRVSVCRFPPLTVHESFAVIRPEYVVSLSLA